MTRSVFVRLAWTTLAVTVAVIVWGAVVRATGSGAGCGSHWPTCNGAVVPIAPGIATIIEYVHRLTSGASMLLVLALVVGARMVFPAGHPVRRWSVASFVFILIEAAVGAGLVLLGLVENNASALRAGYIVVHLTNTMLLVAALTGTTWWAARPLTEPTVAGPRSGRLLTLLIAMIVVAATGAIVALGDTLFPNVSLAQGFAADLDSTSHFLVRLRVFHPILAVAVALATLGATRRDMSFTGPAGQRMRPLVVALVLMQVGFGVINLLMLAPLTLQMAHLVGSNVLWTALVWTWIGGAARRV